jgi:hypothetical protein
MPGKTLAHCQFQLRAGKKVISGIRDSEGAARLTRRGFERLPEKVI